MFSFRKLKLAARRLCAPMVLFSVVAASGYGLQLLQGPLVEPHATQATR